MKYSTLDILPQTLNVVWQTQWWW